MSYLPFGGVTIDGEVNIAKEEHQFDAYGRMRISNVTTLFESQLSYSKQDNLWHTIIDGTATNTYIPEQCSLKMNVDAANGDKVIRQSKKYIHTRLGKSQLIFISGNLGMPIDGITKKIGYFDNDNGVYIDSTNSTVSLIIRSKATSNIIELSIPQTSWNLDQLNGSGTSNINVDFSKDQVFVFDIEWMGTGKVRAGLLIDGDIIYVHEFKFTNSSNNVFMSTSSLPIRFEIENISGANTAEIKQTAVAVMTEGNGNANFAQFSISNNIAPINCDTTLVPILSIKPKLVFNNIVNRMVTTLKKLYVFGKDSDIYFEVRIGTTLTTPMWNEISSDSGVEYDMSSTSISGGEIITSGFSAVGSVEKITSIDELEKILSCVNFDGTDAPSITLCAKTLSSTSDVFVSFVWAEEY